MSGGNAGGPAGRPLPRACAGAAATHGGQHGRCGAHRGGQAGPRAGRADHRGPRSRPAPARRPWCGRPRRRRWAPPCGRPTDYAVVVDGVRPNGEAEHFREIGRARPPPAHASADARFRLLGRRGRSGGPGGAGARPMSAARPQSNARWVPRGIRTRWPRPSWGHTPARRRGWRGGWVGGGRAEGPRTGLGASRASPGRSAPGSAARRTCAACCAARDLTGRGSTSTSRQPRRGALRCAPRTARRPPGPPVRITLRSQRAEYVVDWFVPGKLNKIYAARDKVTPRS